MTAQKFRYPKGRVLAQGYFFPSSIPEEVARSRILSLWGETSNLYKFEFGFVLLQKNSKPEFVENCLGAPLINQAHLLCNVLFDSESESIPEHSGVVVCLALNGNLHYIDIEREPTYDPSVWLDLEAYDEVLTDTLGEIKKPETAVEKKATSVRESLGDAELKESSNLKKTLGRLSEISRNQKHRSEHSNAGFGLLVSRIIRAFRSNGIANGRVAYNPSSENSHSIGIFRKIANAFSQYLTTSALGKAIGKAQAKHVQKMMDQFNDGNLEDALQNAIPLRNMRDALEAKNISLGLTGSKLPQSIQPYVQSSDSVVALESNLLFQMQKMYERAFTVLDQQGKYKKAAFVLAELLRDIDRAVQYLEKHKQYTLAAELAEGQKLDPPRIVRQWVLAGDVQRAMEIAVISGCYQQAITLLQNGHAKEANELRWYCASLHFAAGDLETAVEIAWPVKEKRSEVVDWMKLSFRMGGEVGVRHLLRLVIHDPSSFESYISLIEKKFQSDSFNEGLALIDEIVKVGNQHLNKRIASIAARYYLVSVSEGYLKFDRNRWNQLCLIAGDLTLRADVRGIDFKEFEHNNTETGELTALTFGPSHGRQAEDCVHLVGGLLLIAFGESGLELWNPRGSLITRFSVPCHNIVISDQQNRALLIANRLGYQIVHQFDLKDKSVSHWLELDIHCWADTFDGHSWVVGHEDKVFVLDVLAAEQSTIWSIKELPGLVQSIVRTNESFSICISAEEEFQIWVYKLPNLYLQERTPHFLEKLVGFQPSAMSEKGIIVGISPDQGNVFGIYHKHGAIEWMTLRREADIQSILSIGEFVFLVSATEGRAYADVFLLSSRKIQESNLSISFEAAAILVMRYSGSRLLIHSANGRVVSINVALNRVDTDFILN